MTAGYTPDNRVILRPTDGVPLITRQGDPVSTEPVAPPFGYRVNGHPAALAVAKKGYINHSYIDDFYNRIVVIPEEINLGAFSADMTVNVAVWNTFFRSVDCLAVTVTGGDGVTLSGPAVPRTFSQLSTARWVIDVSADGPAALDCTVKWWFSGLETVSFRLTGSRVSSWSLSPEWSEGVTETLEWKTDVLASRTGAEQRVALRLAARRFYEITAMVDGTDRQQLERMVWQNGGSNWQIPAWPDVTALAADAMAGALFLKLKTSGRDFSAGGQASIKSGQSTEIVQVSAVQPGQLVLSQPLASPWPAGSGVTPMRNAVLTDPPALRRLSDGAVRAQMRFRITDGQEPVTAHGMPEMYRGHPLLAIQSCWSENLTAEYAPLLQTVDNGSGRPSVMDLAGRPFGSQAHRFTLYGQDEQATLRQLLGWLRGRQRVLWIGSQCDDLYPSADLKGGYIDVENTGFSKAGPQPGRRDIRIEVRGGQVYYRRITNCARVNESERMALDEELPEIKQSNVLKISFLTLCRLNSDTVSWEHKTDADGLALVDVIFTGVRDELE